MRFSELKLFLIQEAPERSSFLFLYSIEIELYEKVIKEDVF